MSNSSTPIPNHIDLYRNVHFRFLMAESEISPFAYQPRLPEKDKDGVSVGVYFKKEREKKKFKFNNHSLYKVLADVPLRCGYDCIHTGGRHGLITGDVEKLFNDMDTLIELAENSIFIF